MEVVQNGRLLSHWNIQTAEKALMVEFSPAETARMEHQRRRSMRSINSTGPMHLSYQTTYRISIGSASTAYSPILCKKLRFNPFAHLPTTPIPNKSNGDGHFAKYALGLDPVGRS